MIQRETNVWTEDRELRMPLGTPFPIRMTVLRLPDKSLVLHSPVPIDEKLGAELRTLGEVGYLVGPNCFHHLYLQAAKERYPEALLLGPKELCAKRSDLPMLALHEGSAPAAWRDVLAVVPIAGAPKIAETTLVHQPSRTLVVSDLVFNLTNPSSGMQRFITTIMGVKGKLAQSRVWSMFLKDRDLARASCERLFEHDFARLIVAHGEIVESGARAALQQALTRMGSFHVSAGRP